jgi:hypothetical protein
MPQKNELIGAANHLPNVSTASCDCFNQEPTLTDLFSDPIMYSILAADRVEMGDLCALLERARHFEALAGNSAG